MIAKDQGLNPSGGQPHQAGVLAENHFRETLAWGKYYVQKFIPGRRKDLAIKKAKLAGRRRFSMSPRAQHAFGRGGFGGHVMRPVDVLILETPADFIDGEVGLFVQALGGDQSDDPGSAEGLQANQLRRI